MSKKDEEKNKYYYSGILNDDPSKIVPTYMSDKQIEKLQKEFVSIFKSIKKFKKKASDFNKKHRKLVVAGERAALILAGFLALKGGAEIAHRQIEGGNYIAQEVVDNNPRIFNGLEKTAEGALMYVDYDTGTYRYVSSDEIVKELEESGVKKVDAAITLDVDVDGVSFSEKWERANEVYEKLVQEKKGNTR